MPMLVRNKRIPGQVVSGPQQRLVALTPAFSLGPSLDARYFLLGQTTVQPNANMLGPFVTRLPIKPGPQYHQLPITGRQRIGVR